MEQYKQEFMEFMVRSGVLRFGEFTTKSGRLSPYFINTGNYKTGAQALKLGEYYADCIMANVPDPAGCVLFGPAYKGIPLAVCAASALYAKYGVDVPYCFNRKEAKDHGEGGSFIGHKLTDGDRVIIIEDVMTAGTAVRETLPLLKAAGDIDVSNMIISVDRMEKGAGGTTAVREVKELFGITVHPIVTVKEITEHLHNRELDGNVVIDDATLERMNAYMEQYC